MAIPFSRRPVQCYGTRGTSFTKWIAYGMPHLGQYKWVKEIVFFLYESEEDARAGENAGGTGFLVGLPSKRWGHNWAHVHGVSNWHTACQGASVIRINRRDGEPEIFDFSPDQWIFTPGGNDISVSPLLNLNRRDHAAYSIGIENILTEELETKTDIDMADDVFMIGRFVDYDGIEINEPAARFGHISMVNAMIKQETGYVGRSIVVDMHSRSGFSGSPVFVYRTPGSGFPLAYQHFTGSMLYVLGIHWGQFPEIWELRDERDKAEMARRKDLVTKSQYIEGLSGMTCVVPGQALSDLIVYNAELRAMREQEELQLEQRIRDGLMTAPHPENPVSAFFGASKPTQEELRLYNSLLNQAAQIANENERDG